MIVERLLTIVEGC